MDVKFFAEFDQKNHRLHCSGEWTLRHLSSIRKNLSKIAWPAKGEIILDGVAIEKMDSAGALQLHQLCLYLSKKGLNVNLEGLSEQFQHLFALVKKGAVPYASIPQRRLPGWLEELGRFSWNQCVELRHYLDFVGVLAYEFLYLLIRPHRWRWRSLVYVIDVTGYRALPIIALLSFMIGVVISYQMGNYLRNYGANVFIVNLLGLSILREFSPLITSIMVAGRTGSAFTAELGIMKVNQEIDALRTMGVTPAGLLLLPRIIGLTLTLPLLTMWSNIFGILGGMMMAKNMLDISYYDFLSRFQHEIPLRNLIIGLGKAPVFALIISSIGCFEGMQVNGSAESVGRLTTRSVVLAIFFIIVADAVFSVIFSKLDL